MPTKYTFTVGPYVMEYDPKTGKTRKVSKRPLLKDGKTWQKDAEGWKRKP